MRGRARVRISASGIVAMLALFVALSGTSMAAPLRSAAKGLITGSQIQNGSVTGVDIQNNSLTGQDVRDASLLAKDFKPGQLPQGPAGLQGAKGDKGDNGDKGDKGDKGAPGATKVAIRVVAWNGGSGANADCQSGEVATGGGFYGGGTPIISRPEPATTTSGVVPTGWQAFFSPTTGQGYVYALCVSP